MDAVHHRKIQPCQPSFHVSTCGTNTHQTIPVIANIWIIILTYVGLNGNSLTFWKKALFACLLIVKQAKTHWLHKKKSYSEKYLHAQFVQYLYQPLAFIFQLVMAMTGYKYLFNLKVFVCPPANYRLLFQKLFQCFRSQVPLVWLICLLQYSLCALANKT